MLKSRNLLLSALLGATLFATPVFAQTDAERSAARSAAQQGAAAFQAGDWARAVEYFHKAQGLVDAPTHLLFIARAEEKQGHLVEAREAYIKIQRTQLADGAPAAFTSAKEAADEELPAVEARLPYVTVSVSGGTATQITIDGKEMPGNMVGIQVPINPGQHTFRAVGDGLESPPLTESFSEGQSKAVQLQLVPSDTAAPEPAPGEMDPADPMQDTTTTDPQMDQGSNAQTMKIAGYVGLGVGAVGLGLGTVFMLQRSSKSGDADDAYEQFEADGCVTQASTSCRAQASEIASLDEDAASAGTLSAISFGVGAAAAVTGGVLLYMGLSSDQASAPRVLPYASYDSVGVMGTF